MANNVTATIRIELSPSAKTIRDAVRSFKKRGLISIDDKDRFRFIQSGLQQERNSKENRFTVFFCSHIHP